VWAFVAAFIAVCKVCGSTIFLTPFYLCKSRRREINRTLEAVCHLKYMRNLSKCLDIAKKDKNIGVRHCQIPQIAIWLFSLEPTQQKILIF
jgi:tRNA G26 N,N-dimethylase Trm1